MTAKKKKAGKRKVYFERDAYVVECAVCGETFETVSASAIYCSDACRMKAYRARQK